MNPSIKTIVYLVKDIERAKTLFSKLLGIEPIREVLKKIPAPYEGPFPMMVVDAEDFR